MAEDKQIPEAIGSVPHSTNPASVKEDVEKAMADAVKAEDPPEQEAPAEEKEAPPPEQEAAPEQETPPEKPEPGDLDPPAAWDAEAQTVFRDMPADAQKWVLARHEADKAALEAQYAAVQPYQSFQSQWDPYFRQHGFDPVSALNGLMQTEYQLRTGTPQQKLAALQNIVTSYGLAEHMQAAQPQQPQVPEEYQQDPYIMNMHGQMAELQQNLQNLQSQIGNQSQAAQAAQYQQQAASLEAFRSRVGEDGKPAHPHYDEVLSLMRSIAATAQETGQQTTLEDVYQQACWAHPAVRAKLQGAADAAAIRERQAAAKKKQAAGSSVSGSPGAKPNGALEVKKNESVRQTIERAVAASSGGGHA